MSTKAKTPNTTAGPSAMIVIAGKRFVLFGGEVAGATLYEIGAVPPHRILQLKGAPVPNDATVVPITTGDQFDMAIPTIAVEVANVAADGTRSEAWPIRVLNQIRGAALYEAAGAKTGQVLLRANGAVVETAELVTLEDGEAVGVFSE